MTTRSPFLAASLLAFALLLPGGAAQALDEAEAEALYSRYHSAIEAAKQCRKMQFGDEQHSRMAGVIHAKIEHRIGAKRLSLLTAGQKQARELIDKQGCQGPQVQELLALFDADLAPAL